MCPNPCHGHEKMAQKTQNYPDLGILHSKCMPPPRILSFFLNFWKPAEHSKFQSVTITVIILISFYLFIQLSLHEILDLLTAPSSFAVSKSDLALP